MGDNPLNRVGYYGRRSSLVRIEGEGSAGKEECTPGLKDSLWAHWDRSAHDSRGHDKPEKRSNARSNQTILLLGNPVGERGSRERGGK